MLTDLNLSLIPTTEVTNTEQEQEQATWLASVEAVLRHIEDNRTSKTKPLNDALKVINTEAKGFAKEFEKVKEEISSRLSAYRSGPEVRNALRLRAQQEAKFRAAEKTGDLTALTAHSQSIAEFNALVPKSVPASETMEVRYRKTTTIKVEDEEAVPSEYRVWSYDLKAIERDIEAGQVVPGVSVSEVLKPYCVEKSAE